MLAAQCWPCVLVLLTTQLNVRCYKLLTSNSTQRLNLLFGSFHACINQNLIAFSVSKTGKKKEKCQEDQDLELIHLWKASLLSGTRLYKASCRQNRWNILLECAHTVHMDSHEPVKPDSWLPNCLTAGVMSVWPHLYIVEMSGHQLALPVPLAVWMTS